MDDPSSCGANTRLIEKDLLSRIRIGGGGVEISGKCMAETNDVGGRLNLSRRRLASSIAGNNNTPHSSNKPEERVLGMC